MDGLKVEDGRRDGNGRLNQFLKNVREAEMIPFLLKPPPLFSFYHDFVK